MGKTNKRTVGRAHARVGRAAKRRTSSWSSIWPLAAFGAILLVVAAMVVLAMNQRTPTVVASVDDMQRISLDEARQMLADGDAVLYDTRSLASYHAEHADGALPLPEAELAERLSSLPKDKALIFYCTCPAEETSLRVAFELAQQGLDPDRLYALTGGFRAWLEAGLPTVIGTEPGE